MLGTEEDRLGILTDHVLNASILRLSGEVDFFTAPRLHKALKEVCAQRPSLVLVDLSHVSYLGTPGISELVAAMQDIQDFCGVFRLFGPRGSVMEALSVTNLDDVFEVFESEERALN